MRRVNAGYPRLTFRTRLINLIAEDHAIEDTIYHLHRALNDGRLELDKFLKVRRCLIIHKEGVVKPYIDHDTTCGRAIYEESLD